MDSAKTSLFTDFPLSTSSIQVILCTLFFCSGCSALIYQIVWERMLFTMFGVDLTSITIIVSVFMFGLGIGGLLGGYVADLMPGRLLGIYILVEIGIALFGFASSGLIHSLGNTLLSESRWLTAVASFVILAFPTILMGATFPILVTHINRYNQNVGHSVGSLYFANTLGGAVGAYLCGFVLLYSLELTACIDRAAILNLAIAGTAYLFFRKR